MEKYKDNSAKCGAKSGQDKPLLPESGESRDMLEGRNAVWAALRAERPLDRLYYLRSAEGLGPLLDAARAAGAVLVDADRERLDRMSMTGAHQGVIASAAAYRYAEAEELFALAAERNEHLLLVVCDGIQDEGNLGAVIRTAEVAGAHGVVIPKRRSAGLSPRTAKASAGAAEHLPIVRVPGIPAFLRELRTRNVWIYGSAGEAPASVYDTDFSGAAALVLGGEENGLSRLTREHCDLLISLPMWGKTGSLNVSCAAAALLFAMKQRGAGGEK